jgi:O-succinylbenzoate synthase
VTVKQGKLGGITAALATIDLTREFNATPWIGGMMSSGLGRAVDLALAGKLGANAIPADASPASVYFETDIIAEPLVIAGGMASVPTLAGLGVTVVEDRLTKFATAPRWTIS